MKNSCISNCRLLIPKQRKRQRAKTNLISFRFQCLKKDYGIYFDSNLNGSDCEHLFLYHLISFRLGRRFSYAIHSKSMAREKKKQKQDKHQNQISVIQLTITVSKHTWKSIHRAKKRKSEFFFSSDGWKHIDTFEMICNCCFGFRSSLCAFFYMNWHDEAWHEFDELVPQTLNCRHEQKKISKKYRFYLHIVWKSIVWYLFADQCHTRAHSNEKNHHINRYIFDCKRLIFPENNRLCRNCNEITFLSSR